MNDAPSVVRIVLDGLDDDATLSLLRESSPDASPALAHELRRHTGGNPLFLRSLVHEYSDSALQELASRNELPATRELVATMGERLSLLDPAVVSVLSAIAVLGGNGAEAFVIGAVADVPDVASALDLLTREGLIVTDRGGSSARARIFHGVVQAAVYDNIPAVTR